MNFTTDFNNKELIIKSDAVNPVLVRSVIPQNSLILMEDERRLIVSGRESIDEDTLRAMGTGGKIAGTVLSSAALVIAGLGFFSVCVPFGVGSFILSFFQVIEIISRFKYINVDYGAILTVILEGLDEAIGLPQIPEGFFLGTHLNIFPDTVGKLTYYELSPLSLSTIPIFSVVYIVSNRRPSLMSS